MKTFHLLASVILNVPGKGVPKLQSAIASLTAVVASAAIGIEVFGAPTKALYEYEQELRVTIGNAAFNKRFLYLSGITCCLSLFIKILYALIYRKPVGLVWYSKPQFRHDAKQKSRMIKSDSETWLAKKKPLPYEPEIHPHRLLRRMYFPYRGERSDVEGTGTVTSVGNEAETGTIQFGSTRTTETPRRSEESTEPSFAQYFIQREDDGTFSSVAATSETRKSSGSSSGSSDVKSEKSTIATLKQGTESEATTIEQSVSDKAMDQLLQEVIEVVDEDRNKNRDDSGLDDSGHENYQRNCASSQSNVSCSVSGFIHLPRRVRRNTSKTLRLNSKNDTKDFAGRKNLDNEQSDICHSRSSLRSVSEVNFVDADDQGIWTVALCPLDPIPALADHNKECLPDFSNVKDNTDDKRLEVVSFSQLPHRDCTKRYNMRPSRLTQPYVPSFRFSRGVSYFDKLMKNHNLRSDKEFLHERSTCVHNSPDSNYSLFDLTADHDHLRCLKAASKSVGVDEDTCLGTDSFSDISYGWSETNIDTFKTGFIYGGKRKHDAKGTRCPLSVAALGKCLIHFFCCIFRFLLLITSCMSRRTKNRKENSLAGIRLDELCTPPNLNRTQQEAYYSLRRIGNSRQEGQGQNYKAIGDDYCDNWTTDFDTNYSARDQVGNRDKLLEGSSVDMDMSEGTSSSSGPRERKSHHKSLTKDQRGAKSSDSSPFSTETHCLDDFCDCLASLSHRTVGRVW
ncbi:hypothetical protein PoB_001600800 [Plakobranchus ocellatus]|uniref:Uncharacterized protein n=1 Tax=Plakobranchus ocellatus TaxID=259542 RepID=A0AAV3Z4E2_9GAST|nr:hypothetical protein PoB_001600800 [Plakobranchus ocellatus]